MKKQNAILKIYLTMIFLLILNVSCSSDIKPIKPGPTDKISRNEDPVAQTEHRKMYSRDKFINHKKSMDYPIRDNIWIQKNIMNSQILNIKNEIILYRQVFGHFPDSVTTLVNSGFLLYWPRNPVDGTPAKIINNRDLNEDKTDFSSFTYEVLSDSQITIKRILLDGDHYKRTGEENWIKNSYYYNTSEAQTRDQYVMGGTRRIYEIEDENKRLLMALCSNFHRVLFGNSTLYYSYVEELPTSLEDILFNDRFIIKENFEKLKQTLQGANVDYKWGFDLAKSELYFQFDIDGKRFIQYRAEYGEKEGSINEGGLYVRIPPYTMADLDMSSPIISSENIGSIEIPEEYLISIKDIPLNGG